MVDVVKVAIGKFGCIGVTPLIEMILDERASRKDIEVRTFGCGAKLDADSCMETLDYLLQYDPDLVILVSPNASLHGPTEARKKLGDERVPTVSISDAPAKKAFYKKKDGKKELSVLEYQGFILVPADSMIGAYKEFLDSTEMVAYNADVLKVLAFSGIIRLLQQRIDEIISDLKAGNKLDMPRLIVSSDLALDASGISNPYARSKVRSALSIAEEVASITSYACFREKDSTRRFELAATGHEMMRKAAQLANESRELQKNNHSILRTPHSSDGSITKSD